VQIHFDSDRGHWATSSTLRNRVEIADSLFKLLLTHARPYAAITNQLCQIYSCLAMDDILDVFVLPTQRQNNGTDCGCHAVATAVEFLHEDGDPTADFAVERIREHLIACLENYSFEPFPKSVKRRRGRKVTHSQH